MKVTASAFADMVSISLAVVERMKLTKPGTSGSKIQYYQQQDLYVGGSVVAQTRRFLLTSMDRYVLCERENACKICAWVLLSLCKCVASF